MNRAALFIFPFFLKLTSGVYVSDLAVILDGMFRRKVYRRELVVPVILLSIFFAILSILGALRSQNEISIESFNYPLKIVLFFLYVIYLSRLDYSLRTINIFIFLLSIPVVISVAGFFSPLVYDNVVTLWSTDRHPAYRYGGIFGADVNSYGMYATLVLWLSIYAYYKKYIGAVLLIVAASSALASILISGMRAGVMVLLGLLFVWIVFNFYKISRRSLALIVMLVAFAMLSLYGLYEKSPDIFDVLIGRYSFERFYLDVSFGGESGNLTTAINYYKSVVVREITVTDLIIGYDPGVRYVDSFYVEVLVKYGMIGIFISAFGFIVLFMVAELNKLFTYQFLFIILISLKGVFLLANYFMFVMVFWFFLRLHEYRRSNNISVQSLTGASK